MFNTIRAKLILFSIIVVVLVCMSVTFSYLISIMSIMEIMKTDVSSVADTLEKNIKYISQIKPDAYQDPDFRKMIYSIKIGKTGNAYMMNEAGTLVVHAKEEGANKAGEPIIDKIRAHKGAGTQEYITTVNPTEKLVAYRYYKPWEMWVVAGVNKGDYYQQLKITFIKWNIAFAILMIAVLVVVSSWISRSVTNPLKGLLRIFKGMDSTQGSQADSKETRDVLVKLLENLL